MDNTRTMQAEKIIGIKYIGKTRTVDIEVKNKSHIFYGNGVATSNSHFPLHFYTAWLQHADKKQKPQIEFAELVRDSKQMEVEIVIPALYDIAYKTALNPGNVSVGLINLRQAGANKVASLVETIRHAEVLVNKDIKDFNWYETLFFVFDKMNKTLVENIICAGILDFVGRSRQGMMYEYKYWNMLTKKQKEYVRDFGSTRDSLASNIDTMMKSGKVRLQKKNAEKLKDVINLLEHPTSSLDDTIEWVARKEQELYGISLSCHRVQAYEKTISNCTIHDFLNGYENKNIVIAAEIRDVRFWHPPDDESKKIAYLTIEDETGGTPNIVVYNNQVDQFIELLYEGNIVYLSGYRQKNKQERFIVNKITPL